MLTYHGKIDLLEMDEDFLEAAKMYLPLYGKDKEECKVPVKNGATNQVSYLKFVYLADQWVFTEIVQ